MAELAEGKEIIDGALCMYPGSHFVRKMIKSQNIFYFCFMSGPIQLYKMKIESL